MDANILINPYFNVDLKKDNFFRRVGHASEFFIRFFKKIYQFYGFPFFENTSEYVTELNSD